MQSKKYLLITTLCKMRDKVNFIRNRPQGIFYFKQIAYFGKKYLTLDKILLIQVAPLKYFLKAVTLKYFSISKKNEEILI